MADSDERESLLGIFLMEAWDTLATLEDGVARLRDTRAPVRPALEPLVVVSHRLRGAAALHGFARVSDVAGVVEEFLERLEQAPPESRRSAADFLTDLVDTLKRVLDAIATRGAESAAEIDALIARYPAVFATPEPAPRLSTRPGGGEGGDDSAEILAYFAPEAAEHLETMTRAALALERGGNPDVEVPILFRAVHTLKGAAYTVGFTVVGDVAHRIEDLLAAVREGRTALAPPVIEAVLAGMDALRLVLAGGDGARAAGAGPVVERAVAQLERLLPVSGEPAAVAPTPPAVPAPAPAPAAAVVPAAAEAAQPDVWRAPVGPAALRAPVAGPGVRVSLTRLDALMNLVGELVIARSRLDRRLVQLDRIGELLLASRARMARAIHELDRRPADEGGAGPVPSVTPLTALFAELEFDRYDDVDLFRRSATEMTADLSEVQAQLAALVRAISEDTALIQRLTGQLRDEITHARMVPVGRLFARFARQVREAGRVAGKAVLLQTSGEAVEVDNTIVEQIADPLLHLIQNAIVHGIEPAAERRARGKPEEGVVRLGAFHRGGFVHVRVEDDGGGVDVARLRAEAVRQRRLTAEAAAGLSDREALDLMFQPGFSTAAAVTTAAGRGVGLDVVRTNIARLNGEIAVETEPGAGTRFTLKVPLTLVISNALMVWAGETLFAIPLAAVRFVVQVRPAEVGRHGRTERIRVEDQPVDLIRLDRVLGLAGAEPPSVLPVVVLRAGARSVGLAVSRLGGKEEIVIKTLAGGLDVGPFAGATISGEGRVILLLDAVRLVELAERLAAGGPAAGRRAAAAPTPAAARPAEARRVLLVDDSVSVRKFVGHMLERAGFVVVTANDGVEALERLQEVSVDLVITDLEMPRMNGYELIEDLRHRASARGVPIVVLTTRAGEKHESLARRLGVEHYVTKPVDEHAFVRLIESLTAGGPVEAGALSGAAR